MLLVFSFSLENRLHSFSTCLVPSGVMKLSVSINNTISSAVLKFFNHPFFLVSSTPLQNPFPHFSVKKLGRNLVQVNHFHRTCRLYKKITEYLLMRDHNLKQSTRQTIILFIITPEVIALFY